MTVMRGDADKPTRVRTIKAGQTGTLRPGYWIVEQPEMLHSVMNRGKTDAVVVQATLYPRGASQTVND